MVWLQRETVALAETRVYQQHRVPAHLDPIGRLQCSSRYMSSYQQIYHSRGSNEHDFDRSSRLVGMNIEYLTPN